MSVLISACLTFQISWVSICIYSTPPYTSLKRGDDKVGEEMLGGCACVVRPEAQKSKLTRIKIRMIVSASENK
jgi:hypothetical protein